MENNPLASTISWLRAPGRGSGFVHGFALALLLMLGSRWQYENAVLDGVVQSALHPGMSEQEQALALMGTVHTLMWPRKLVYASVEHGKRLHLDPPGRMFFDAPAHLNTGVGACGSFSTVTTRVLQRAGFEARMSQMLCGSTTCHVFVEAKVQGHWAALDPLFGLTFTRPDGRLASAAELSADWPSYSRQVPLRSGEMHYPLDKYRYEGVRYTNWSKFPVLMPALHAMLGLFMGDAVDQLSLRTYVLNQSATLFLAVLAAYPVLLATLAWRGRRRRRDASSQAEPA